MSQYNKTILTNAGLGLAKRANAGQAKFEITRAVTSADDWSSKTIQDLEAVTAIPNIMQQGTVMDTEEVESNNSVIGVSLCFANKDLSAGYRIRIIGVYVKEEGQDEDFLYAVTTAVTPEYMPDFNDKVLYRFNMQMYLVIGKAQAVNVVINDGASVTHGQFDKYKGEVAANLEKIENAHKEDMSHVVKSASINGGSEVLPNEAGKLELVVPDPDLSKYVSLEQLKEMLKTKADITAVPDKTDTEEGIRQAKAAAKAADDKAQIALDSKADKTDVYTKKAVDDAFSTRDSKIDGAVNLANRAQETANIKANASDVYTKSQADNKLGQKITFVKCDSPQAAHDASTKPAADGSIVFGIYDMNDEPSEAYVAGQKINIEWLYNHLTDLQSTVSNGLATKANQSDLDQTNAEVAKKANSSDVSALQNAVNSGLAGKQDAINPNLFTGSKDFTGDWINLDRVNQKDKYLDFTAVCSNWPWGGISQYIDVKAGETVTASVYTKANAGTELHWYTALNTDNEGGHTKASTSPSGQAITATGDWQRTSITFTATSDGTIKPRIENDGSVPFWIAGMKLEKGAVATDWCPAIEDYAWESDITNLRNQINQQSQTIQSLTTRLTNAENEISYIKANYIEGKRFPASQEAQAVAWENENPQRIAFITDD